MNNAVLFLNPTLSEIMVGERLEVVTGFRNDQSIPIAIQDILPNSPFEYLLSSKSDPSHVYTVSSAQNRQKIAPSGEVVPMMKPPMKTIQPGEFLSLKEDLTQFLSDTQLEAGKFEVVARCRRGGTVLNSLPVEISILPFGGSVLKTLFCPASKKWCAIHTGKVRGADNLFIRETHTAAPSNGSAIAVASALVKQPVISCAIAIQMPGKNPQGRWYAWLNAEGLSGTRFWGLPTTKMKPFATRLDEAVLVSPGLQSSDNSALFCVAGTENGNATVVGCRIGTDGQVTEVFRLGIGPVLPTTILPAFDVAGGTLSLFWTTKSADVTKIWCTDITMTNRKASPPTVVREVAGLLHCFSVAPLSTKNHTGLEVLYRPRGEQHLVRLSIDKHNPASSVETSFEPPAGPVDKWALAIGTRPAPVIAFSKEYVLWCTGGSDKQWKVLAHVGEQPLSASVFTTEEHVFWVEWATVQRGLCFSRIQTPE